MTEKKDYRKTIGKRLEEALREDDFKDLEELIEVPSTETWNEWIREAEEDKKIKVEP